MENDFDMHTVLSVTCCYALGSYLHGQSQSLQSYRMFCSLAYSVGQLYTIRNYLSKLT